MTQAGRRPFVARRGRVLRCVLSTAPRGASLDFDGVREATAAVRALDADVGAVLLVGEGPNFCTGADVRMLGAEGDRLEAVRALAGELHDLVHALAEAPVPVIAAVHGWAAGAGMSLALAADLAVAGMSTGCGRRTPRSGSPRTAG